MKTAAVVLVVLNLWCSTIVCNADSRPWPVPYPTQRNSSNEENPQNQPIQQLPNYGGQFPQTAQQLNPFFQNLPSVNQGYPGNSIPSPYQFSPSDAQPSFGNAATPGLAQSFPSTVGSSLYPVGQTYPAGQSYPAGFPSFSPGQNVFPNQPLTPEAFPTQSFVPQSFPSQSYTPQSFPEQSFGPQTLPEQSFAPQPFPGQSFAPQTYPLQSLAPQAFPGQSFVPVTLPVQSFPSQSFTGQSFPSQSFPVQPILAQAYSSPSLPVQGTQPTSFPSLPGGFPSIGFPSIGFPSPCSSPNPVPSPCQSPCGQPPQYPISPCSYTG